MQIPLKDFDSISLGLHVIWEIRKQFSSNMVDGNRDKTWWAEMDEEKGLLNGKFSFKVQPAGSLHKNKVISIYCQWELSHHWIALSLKYHLLAKHTTDAESPSLPH